MNEIGEESEEAGGVTEEDPVTLVRNAITKAEREDFDQVLVLVDVDDTPANQLRQSIELLERSSVDAHLIVSNECFEVWLLAHFEVVDPAWGRPQLAEKLVARGAVSKENVKHLPPTFPIGEFRTARNNVKAVPADTRGPSGSTAAGVVVDEFQRRSGNRP